MTIDTVVSEARQEILTALDASGASHEAKSECIDLLYFLNGSDNKPSANTGPNLTPELMEMVCDRFQDLLIYAMFEAKNCRPLDLNPAMADRFRMVRNEARRRTSAQRLIHAN